MVHDNDNQTTGHLHGKRRDTDCQDVPDNPSFQAEITRVETDDALPVNKMAHDENSTSEHRKGRRNGGTPDPHIKTEDKHRIENDIQDGTQHHRDHRLLRITRSTHDRIEVKRQIGEEIGRYHDIKIIHRIR